MQQNEKKIEDMLEEMGSIDESVQFQDEEEKKEDTPQDDSSRAQQEGQSSRGL